MRAPGIVACLVVAVAAALVALATCTERAGEPPAGEVGGAAQPVAPADPPSDVRTARRNAPRAAVAPVPGDTIAADDAAKPGDVEADPPDGDPVTFTIGVPQGTAMGDVRLRAWAMCMVETSGGGRERGFVALGGARVPGDDGRVVIRTKDRGIAVLAYARAPGLHSRGEPATESNGWAARIELGAGVEVRGVVTDADGRPVAGAEVRLVPRDRAAHGLRSSDPRAWAAPGVFEHYVASVTADADGRYVIRGVPLAREGRTAVRHLPIARDAAGAWWAGEALWARSEAETVVRDLRLGAEAYVAEPAPNRMSVHVGGTVVVAEEEGTPVPDASVALVVAVRGDFEADGDRTAEDGSFDVSLSWEGSLAEDDPVLVVRAEGFRTQRVPAAAPEAGDKLVVALVKDVRGEARGAIRGRATDEGASVAGRLRIRCESEWGEQRDVMVVADTQGKFRLAGLEPGWWRLSAGWPDRTPVLVRAGEETDAVVRAVRWESDPRPWTDDDEVAWRQAERDFFETMRQRASEEGEGGTPEEQRARHDEAFARMHELGESRARRIARRAVRVRGLVASGPAWLTARSHSSTSQETWIAEVSSAEAYFPALAVGAWSFELTCRDGAPDWFRMKVPAEGKGAKGELVLDAARAER